MNTAAAPLDALPGVTRSHARAANAAALVLRHRLDQHTAQAGQEPRMVMGSHLMHLTSAIGQVAHVAGQLNAPRADDTATLEELRGELVYLCSAGLALLEELERRTPEPVEESVDGYRRQALARRMVDDPSPELAAMSAAEHLGQLACEASRDRSAPSERVARFVRRSHRTPWFHGPDDGELGA